MSFGLTVLLTANAVVAASSVAFAIVAAVHPEVVSHTVAAPDASERFYVWMYLARALPLGLLAGIVPLTSSGTVSMSCLIAVAAVQLADAGIGLLRRQWTMLGGASVAAIVHFITAFAIA